MASTHADCCRRGSPSGDATLERPCDRSSPGGGGTRRPGSLVMIRRDRNPAGGARVLTAVVPRIDARELAAIFAGGALGTVARVAVVQAIPVGAAAWPWST